jgi:hypothetical protein
MDSRDREGLVWGVVLAICLAVILYFVGLLVVAALDSGA